MRSVTEWGQQGVALPMALAIALLGLGIANGIDAAAATSTTGEVRAVLLATAGLLSGTFYLYRFGVEVANRRKGER